MSRGRSVLLGLTGLRIEGGIACVSRCVARALDEEVGAGRLESCDRVLLLDPPDSAPPAGRSAQWLSGGSQARFVWQLWRAVRRQRPAFVFFDHVGLARSVTLPLPGFPPRTCLFVHGIELTSADSGSRARALRLADRLITNSAFTARAVTKLVPEVADRVVPVPLCIDPQRVAVWETHRGPEPPREPAALIVGRIWSEQRGKGHDALIEAWSSVRGRVPKAELWVVGSGDDLPRLEQKARAAGVADAVRFLGRVSDDDLGDLYRKASVFAMPSRQEGFGLVYAEAMWHGLPCIGSTADAAAEVIRDGETGQLVPYDDPAALATALIALLGDREGAARLGAEAQRHARSYFGYARFRRDLLEALPRLPGDP